MTEKKYIVALDQGTTSSRAVVMDHDANIISVSQREFEQIYPKPGGRTRPNGNLGHPKLHAGRSAGEAISVPIKLQLSVLRTSVKPLLSGKKKPASYL